MMCIIVIFFFFKQKTAYEMRISDWSSTCGSSDLWLSDRDRYSHQGMYAPDRLHAPQVKRDGQWHDTTWEDALAFAGEALKKAPGSELGILAHPSDRKSVV